MLERAGPHGDVTEKCRLNKTPSAARASRCGVFTTGWPSAERHSPRHWSAEMNRTLRGAVMMGIASARVSGIFGGLGNTTGTSCTDVREMLPRMVIAGRARWLSGCLQSLVPARAPRFSAGTAKNPFYGICAIVSMGRNKERGCPARAIKPKLRQYSAARSLDASTITEYTPIVADAIETRYMTEAGWEKVRIDSMPMAQLTHRRASLRSNSNCCSRRGDATNPKRV